LLIITFAFDDFKSLPQNFSLIQNSSKFGNLGLGGGKNGKVNIADT
jgi:hypothetical protein